MKALKTTVDAFVLPEGGKLAIYVGLFRNPDRAMRYAALLEQKQIKATRVTAEIETQGNMLVVQHVDRQTAQTISDQVSRLGLTANVRTPSPDSMQ